jgi:hypothetical protein
LDNEEIERIKQKSIVGYLEASGYKPKNSQGRTFKYLCPWRPENTPSLIIYKATNTWVDFASKKGGSIIHLVMELESCSFKEALDKLRDSAIPERKVYENVPKEHPIKILYSCPIQSEWLIRYIESRCVPVDIAKRYCEQVRVEMVGKDKKTYRKTCVGFKSDHGSWELRNKFTKISTSPKWWSTINPQKDKCKVVEGFFDLLSLIRIFGYNPDFTYICLNSASFAMHVDWAQFKLVQYYGHNDEAGDRALTKLPKETIDMRSRYNRFNDLNDWLINTITGRNEPLSLLSNIIKLI